MDVEENSNLEKEQKGEDVQHIDGSDVMNEREEKSEIVLLAEDIAKKVGETEGMRERQF